MSAQSIAADSAQKRILDWEGDENLRTKFAGDFKLYAISLTEGKITTQTREPQKSESNAAEVALKTIRDRKTDENLHAELSGEFRRPASPQAEEVITMATKKNQSGGCITGEFALKTIQAWKADENLRAEFSGNFDQYASFVRATAAGKARICGKSYQI